MDSEPIIAGLPVTVKVSARARRLRLRVDARRRAVLLTVPQRVSQKRALAWAAEHSEWLHAAMTAIPPQAPVGPGAIVPLRGEAHRIDWSPSLPRRVERQNGRLCVGGPAETVEGRILRWLKVQAQELLGQETWEFAAKAGVKVSKTRVGDPTTRWGSCSSTGVIAYSWRLILAPDFVRRATVAHEVAHLIHMNHGPEFHALVDELLGEDARPAWLWLRRNGAGLHQIGSGNG